MPEVQLQVEVNPDSIGLIGGAISFETGLTREQAADPTLYAYEHHGQDFSIADPGSLSSFYEDLVLGRPMPTKFVTRAIGGIDTVFAITLFMHRDLVPLSIVSGAVTSVDFVHRRGIAGLAHIDESLAVFLYGLTSLVPKENTRIEEAVNLKKLVGMVRDYLSSGYLPYQNPLPIPTVKDVGSDGFVRGEVRRGSLILAWAFLFRSGYLKGFVVGPDEGGRRAVVATRKSVYVSFNLPKAASLLNEIEVRLGNRGEWSADELWLHSPSGGTRLEEAELLEVFLRV